MIRLLLIFGLVFSSLWGFGQTTALSGESIRSLVQSPDGLTYVTVFEMGGVRIWDAKTNRVMKELNNKDFEGLTLGKCRGVYFVQPGVIAVLGFSELRLFNINTGQKVATFSVEQGNDILVSSSGRHALRNSRGQTEIIELATRKVVGVAPIVYHVGMNLSADGQRIYKPGDTGVDCFDAKSARLLFHYQYSSRLGAQRVVLSDDENFVVGLGYTSTYVWNKTVAQVKSEIKTQNWNVPITLLVHNRWLIIPGPIYEDIAVHDLQTPSAQKVIKPSSTSSITGVGISSISGKLLISEVTSIRQYDLGAGTAVASGVGGVADTFRSACLSFEEDEFFMGTEDGRIKYFDMATGSYRGVYWNYGKPVRHLKFESQGRELEIGDGKVVDVFQVSTRKKIRSYPDQSNWQSATVKLDRAETMYATLLSGELAVRNKNGSLKIVTRKGDNRDYFVTEAVTNYFEGSTEGINELGLFGSGGEVIQASQLKTRFFKPDLFFEFFHGNLTQFAINDRISLYKLEYLHPSVSLSSEGSLVKVKLTDRGGGIGPVSLYINRKLVSEDIRSNAKGPAQNPTFSIDVSKYNVFDSQTENRIEVEAYNKGGYMSSNPEKITILPKIPKSGKSADMKIQASKQNQKPKLWALVVGVSKYAGRELDLKFAAKDAEDLATAIKIGSEPLFGDRVNIIKLTSESRQDSLIPSARNIRNALNRIQDEAAKDDIVMFYFAGHGQTALNRDEFFFLTSEARSFSSQYSANESITDNDILQALRKSRSQKQVLILDACYSGKVIDNIAARGELPSTIKALDRMRDQSGAFILTGATSTQAAWECTEFGQGLLTHYLLEGMRGPCLDDGVLTVLKWLEYSKDRVEKYTMDRQALSPGNALLAVQTPRIFSMKDIFPMAIAQFPDVASRSKIPLAEPKLLVSASSLHTDGLDDPLDLGDLLNKTLESAPLSQSPFYFIGDVSYPGVYRISGTYTTDAGKKKVAIKQLKVFQGKVEKGRISVDNIQAIGKNEVVLQLVKQFENYCRSVKRETEKK